MVQNLKVDIIYHLTPSDFEMEFNLCGCCRMRLLSDKTTDKKGFIKALARDVSRSRVIIACGPLFGADGLIATVATAIGNGTVVCDNKTYGIASDEQIHIIKGSTPLVTPDGYFGGCIIESGPQTIILLTENKAFRKSIMQNLIHPYIDEISYIPTKSSPLTAAAEPKTVFETAVTENENYLTDTTADTNEPDIEQTEPLPIPKPEHNIDFVMDDEELDKSDSSLDAEPSPIFDNSYNTMYTEVEKPQEVMARYSEPYTPSESDNMFVTDTDNDDKFEKSKRNDSTRAMDIAVVILVLLLLLAVLALVYLIVLKPMTMGISTGDYLKEIFATSSNAVV